MKTYVFYHYGCVDGSFAAALRYHNSKPDEDVTFLEFRYNTDNLYPVDMDRQYRVEFLDCSPTKEDMEKILNSKVLSVLVVDHHETAGWLIDFSEKENEKRGRWFIDARINIGGGVSATHIYYHKIFNGDDDSKLERFVNVVSRADTRAPTLTEMTEEELNVRATIGLMNSEFSEACAFVEDILSGDLADSSLTFDKYYHIGKILTKNQDKNIDAIVKKAFLMSIHGTEMPVVSIGRSDYGLINKALNTLAENHPSKVACSFYIDAGGIRDDRRVKLSFRSVGTGAAALSVAQRCGGGGHENSAGALLGEQESLRFMTACLSRSKF